MRRLLSALVIAGLATVPAVDRPAAADAATPAPVALAGFSSIVADEAHGHLFIGQGAKGGVVVSDLEGDAVTTLDGLVGATDLQLTPSGDAVIAALGAAHKVVAIDTTTLEVTEWATGERCPGTVAPVDGAVWFTDTCRSGLSAIEPDGTVTVVSPYDEFSQVRSTPSAPGTIVSLGEFDEVTVYDASVVDGAPTLTSVTSQGFDDVLDLDVAPDGSGVLVQEYGGWPRIWSATDLATPLTASYQLDNSSQYVGVDDIRADGTLFAGEEVFEPGQTEALVVLELGGYVRGADWGTKQLYAVVEAGGRPLGRFSLHVVQVRAPSKVTIKASDTKLIVGQDVRLTLALATRSADRQVVVRSVTAGGSKIVARPRVPAAGKTIAIEPRRNTTYVVRYAGDDAVGASEASVDVGVAPKVALKALDAGTVRHGVAYYRSGQTARLRATVEAYPGGCVTFHVYFRRIREWIFSNSVRCVHLNRDGLADLRVRSRAGEHYYASKILVTFDANDNNISARPSSRRIQFCPGSVPCKAPVG